MRANGGIRSKRLKNYLKAHNILLHMISIVNHSSCICYIIYYVHIYCSSVHAHKILITFMNKNILSEFDVKNAYIIRQIIFGLAVVCS